MDYARPGIMMYEISHKSDTANSNKIIHRKKDVRAL